MSRISIHRLDGADTDSTLQEFKVPTLFDSGDPMNETDDFGFKAGSGSAAAGTSTTGIIPLKSTQCRLFPADARQASDDVMEAVGDWMQTPGGEPGPASRLPAGYVFLSQFIEHDISPPAEQDELQGFRCRTLDLDCVYGDAQVGKLLRDLANPDKMAIGVTVGTPEFGISHAFSNDLPRIVSGSSKGQVMIGDNRNDQNLGVAQTHLQFLKLHNRFVDLGMDYRQAQCSTIQHYQSMLINDYLKKILNPNIFNLVFNRPSYQPFTPKSCPLSLEFALSAFTFVYSMFNETYEWNGIFESGGEAGPVRLNQLFRYSHRGAYLGIDFHLPTHSVIDWRRFFTFPNEEATLVRNMARPIGAGHLSELSDLIDRPGSPGGRLSNLATRILLLGKRLRLASGESAVDILNERGLAVQKLDREQLETGDFPMNQGTPFWYYLMRESQVQQNGNSLGELGSWIVADGFKRLLLDSPNSVLSDTRFAAQPRVLDGNNFTSMKSIIQFNDDVAPLKNI